jgi:hypothetical protein
VPGSLVGDKGQLSLPIGDSPMVLVAVFGVALLIAVLLSGLAARTILSTSFLFLVGGALVSDGFLGLIHLTPDSEIVSVTADLSSRRGSGRRGSPRWCTGCWCCRPASRRERRPSP